jgi:hypothetical protein
MRIAEVFLLESFFDELEVAIRDRLAKYAGEDVNEIPTQDFKSDLAADGFLLSTEELIAAMNKLDVVNGITADSITPRGKIDNDMVDGEDPEEPEVDVASLAGDQALSSVKDQLPQ